MVRAKRSKNGGFGWLYCKSLETAIIILLSLSLVYSHYAPLANSPSLSLSYTHTHTHSHTHTRANIPDYSDWQNIVTHTLKRTSQENASKYMYTFKKGEKEGRRRLYLFFHGQPKTLKSNPLSFGKFEKSRPLQNDVSYRNVRICKSVYLIFYVLNDLKKTRQW